jgi:pyridoxamine 5'-phosphate oxidase
MSPCPELDALRQQLQDTGLSRSQLAADPFEQFGRWFDVVVEAGLHEPEAMIVSTVGRDDRPSSRYVLLRGVDHGFVFYTNYESRKGAELAVRPGASICFPWHVLSRQLRVTGRVEQVSAAESDAYFASRARDSQVSAWASRQSDVIGNRAELEARVVESEHRFEGGEVPRPPHWGGYRIVPDEFEFWQGRRSRLHDRFRYLPDGDEPSGWRIDRLNP